MRTFPHGYPPLDFALVDSHGRMDELCRCDNFLFARKSLDPMVERERNNVVEGGRKKKTVVRR